MPLDIPPTYADGKHALARALPYMTPPAVGYLDVVLRRRHVVIDVGAGGSSLFFANRCRCVVAVEPRREWADRVAKRGRELGLENLHVIWSGAQPDHLLWAVKRLGACDVVSVDCDRRFSRDLMLDAVIARSRASLQLVVMDNYAEPQHFPKTARLDNAALAERLGQATSADWSSVTSFDDAKWRGRGTRVATRADLRAEVQDSLGSGV